MKKVSIKTLEKFCKVNYPKDIEIKYQIDNSEFVVKVKPRLNIDEICSFIERVVNLCFTDDGEYTPEYIDAAFKITFAQYMTNLTLPFSSTSDENASVGIIRAIDIIDSLNIIEKTCSMSEEIDYLVRYIKNCVGKKLEYKIDLHISQVHKQLTEIISKLNTYAEYMENVFDGVDINNLMKSADVMASKIQNLSEKQVIDSVVNSLHKAKSPKVKTNNIVEFAPEGK